LPFSATRVVKAIPEELLPWTLKGLWLEHVALDHGPAGCFLGATGMAQRTGLSPHTVERSRRILAAIGLLVKLDAPRGATAGWVPTLPDGCIPDTRTLTPEQLGAWRQRLVAHLAKWQPTIHRSERAEEPIGRQSGSRLAATRDENAAADRPPLPARTSRKTGSQPAGGMEKLEEVGEKPPTAVGGRARANSNGERRASPEMRSMRELVAVEMARAAAARRRREAKR
jgi:hypothetical protein